MKLEQPEPTRQPKRTFLVAYSNPAASLYLHWLKKSTDHHEVALDCRPDVTTLQELVAIARDRADFARAVGSEFDEVWVVFDGPVTPDRSDMLDVGVVVNTPDISAWLDLHARAGDTSPIYAGRYGQAKLRATASEEQEPGSDMYLLVDAMLESLRAFRALDAPPAL